MLNDGRSIKFENVENKEKGTKKKRALTWWLAIVVPILRLNNMLLLFTKVVVRIHMTEEFLCFIDVKS